MRTILPVIVLLFSPLAGQGQSALHHKAEKYLHGFEYAAAAETLEKIATQNPSDVLALEGLALCYDKLNDPKNAEIWLARLCSRPEAPNRYYRSYAEVLAANGNYPASALWYTRYLEAVPDVHASNTITQYHSIESFYADSSYYTTSQFAFNTSQSDFSPAFYEKGIVFCSSALGENKIRHGWDNSPFIDLYWVNDLNASPIPFGKPINSPFHEGPSVLTQNSDTLYFTRNSSSGHRQVASRDGIVRLSIFYSVRKNGVWQKEQGLSLNNDSYSIGHPALSRDHQLYFVSDMPGGFGGTDIYVSNRTDGKWSAPVNLGPEINTPGNEMFPFIDDDGNLYFASNTHPGLGGLDIFHSKKENSKFTPPENLGYPINSSKDDFGLIIKNNEGFFSSNRGLTTKDDNIYSFASNKMKSLLIMAATKDGNTLRNFDIVLTNGDAKETKRVDLAFSAQFNGEKKYLIECSKPGYQNQSLTLESVSLIALSNKDTIRMILTEALKNFRVQLQSTDGNRLAGGMFEIRNMNTGKTQTLTADVNGLITVPVNAQLNYELTGSQSGYKSKTVSFHSADLLRLENETPITVILSPANTLFERNEIGQLIELDIRYDIGKATIRTDAAQELDKLVTFLKKNMTVKVELGSHTDIRGSEEANHILSQKRAESSVRYVIGKGISSQRLIPIGYGEGDPKVKEAATEEEHQQNRRTTVKIVGI